MQYEEKFIVINKKYLVTNRARSSVKSLYSALTDLVPYLPNNKYYVCNQDEPYAGKVYNIIEKGEDAKLEPNMYVERPPLGLVPEFILLEKRNKEVLKAIVRYTDSDHPDATKVLLSWTNEFRHNLQRLDEIRHKPLDITKIGKLNNEE